MIMQPKYKQNTNKIQTKYKQNTNKIQTKYKQNTNKILKYKHSLIFMIQLA
jgi:hypothetical protein